MASGWSPMPRCYRRSSIATWPSAVADAVSLTLALVDEVFPIERSDVLQAQAVLAEARLSARDAVHVAVMRRRGVDRILTFDEGFDVVPDVVRISAGV